MTNEEKEIAKRHKRIVTNYSPEKETIECVMIDKRLNLPKYKDAVIRNGSIFLLFHDNTEISIGQSHIDYSIVEKSNWRILLKKNK